MPFYPVFEALLKEKGITARKLSLDTGISSGLLTDWKKRRCEPGGKNLKKLADYFGVNTDYLLGQESLNLSHNINSGNITITIGGNSKVHIGDKNFSESLPKTVEQPNFEPSELPEEVLEFYKIYKKLSLRERTKLMALIYEFEEKNESGNL
jgi:transcriptional regulator with XRE-family HTH domain